MQINKDVQSETPLLGLSDYVILCLGFGCFFAVCPFSALGTAALLRNAMTWQEILASRVAFLAAAAFFFAVQAARGCGWCVPTGVRVSKEAAAAVQALLGALGAAGAFVLLAVGSAVFSKGMLAAASGGLLGFAMATLGSRWFEAFFAVRCERGRTACVVMFACSFLVTVVLTWACNLMGLDGRGSLVAVLLFVATSLGLLGILAHRLDAVGEKACQEEGLPARARGFEPSPYARVLLLGFGASWACTYTIAIEMGYGEIGPDQFVRWALTLVSCGALLVLSVVFVRKVDIGDVRFGLMLRWVVTVVGCLWAFMPALVEGAPIAVCVLCIMVFWVQLTVLFVFVMEVCLEGDLPFFEVLARYFGIFALAAGVGSGVFWLLKVAVTDERLMYALLGGFGAACFLLVIPFLPSRGSSANVFTMARLPEDDSAEGRHERARQALAHECGFTTRETEVFELLMRGLTRDEVAAELRISPWTVKNHIRAVFAKTGTHSTKELMALVYDGEG